MANDKVPLTEQGVWIEAQEVQEQETIRTSFGWVEVLSKLVGDDYTVLVVRVVGKRPKTLRLVNTYQVLVRDRIVKEKPEPLSGYELALQRAISAHTYQGIKYSADLYDALKTTVGEEARIKVVQSFLFELLNLADEKLAETFPVAIREMLRAYVNECLKHVEYAELVARLLELWGIE